MSRLAEAKSLGWTMSAFEKPQIISHIQKSLNYTVFDCKWMPCSAKFVTMGNLAGHQRHSAAEIQQGDLKLLQEVGAGARPPSSKIWDCCWRSADLGGGSSAFLFAKAFVQHSPKAVLKLRGSSESDRRLRNNSDVKTLSFET